MSVEHLAEGIVRIAVAKMAGAIREISVSRGLDPRRFTLVAYGGAGPMHGALVAEELGIASVLIPRLPGNFSAIGLLSADLRWDAARSLFVRLDDAGIADIGAAVASLKAEVSDHLACDGVSTAKLSYETYVQMNYIGQASSFSVNADENNLAIAPLHSAFLSQYEDRYGHANPGRQIAVSGVRVVAIAASQKPNVRAYQDAGSAMVMEASRKVVFGDEVIDCAVLERSTLNPGDLRAGPAVIEESGSTTVVPPGWSIAIDEFLNIRLSRSALPEQRN
jgi:N-methylhydantoinase A